MMWIPYRLLIALLTTRIVVKWRIKRSLFKKKLKPQSKAIFKSWILWLCNLLWLAYDDGSLFVKLSPTLLQPTMPLMQPRVNFLCAHLNNFYEYGQKTTRMTIANLYLHCSYRSGSSKTSLQWTSNNLLTNKSMVSMYMVSSQCLDGPSCYTSDYAQTPIASSLMNKVHRFQHSKHIFQGSS